MGESCALRMRKPNKVRRIGAMSNIKITKQHWYQLGGFRNYRCFRRMFNHRGWSYFYSTD